ncbi:MAG: TetR/AcrR family transcriptional regulator [Trueperaceae bacterium]|nr:TetR/AcrR family transcriptional regulator [Trueperaceae bacterium]
MIQVRAKDGPIDMTRPPSTDPAQSRSSRKRQAILAAATEAFLQGGYLGTNMDEVAALSGVSKQTIYSHFGNKEALFVEIVTGMTLEAGDRVHEAIPHFEDEADASEYLLRYADLQLEIVLTPRLMQLRRLVIGEAHRFPELGKALFENGPKRSMATLEAAIKDFARRGMLDVEDAALAAGQLNWLIMSTPLNLAMLLGDAGIPSPEELRRYAAQGVATFLAAYGKR